MKTYLKYRLNKLTPLANGIYPFAFQVLEESKEVKAFLNEANFYDKTTGFRVMIADYPEVKDSMNIIYLHGNNPAKDDKVDITRTVGSMQRDNRMNLVNTTLKNLVKTVRKGGLNELKQYETYSL